MDITNQGVRKRVQIDDLPMHSEPWIKNENKLYDDVILKYDFFKFFKVLIVHYLTLLQPLFMMKLFQFDFSQYLFIFLFYKITVL